MKQEAILNALISGLQVYCKQHGFKKAVVGVSGGIDSSVTAAIATRALGNKNVLAVNLPSKFSSKKLQKASKKLAKNLEIDYKVLPIQKSVNLLVKEHEKEFYRIKNPVTIENFQARVRAIKLMGISNDINSILLATGNKTEIYLGYATLYGDLAGGLAVIGDLNKMQVYKLAEFINKDKKIIPPESISAVPSAELHLNQKDPFDYKVVAPLVDDIVAGKNKEELIKLYKEGNLRYAFSLNDKDFMHTLKDTLSRIKKSVHKRKQAPPILKVFKKP